MKAWNLYQGAIPILAPSGDKAEINDQCTGCGDCKDACHFNAISFDQESLRVEVIGDKCMGCGVCEDKCPAQAIGLKRDPEKGDPLDLAQLLKKMH